MNRLCGNCFCESLNEQGICTQCGFDSNQNREKAPHALPAGSILNGRYIIGRVLGQGGFGITYTARDHLTGETVAVKEFFPDSMATRSGPVTVTPFSGERGENFAYGRESFLHEAETMAEFIGNPNIVRVYSYFEENGTAYFVMEFVDGMSFQEYIRTRGGRLSFDEAMKVLMPVMQALSVVHEKGIIHRDVTPDNIYISKDGTVKLLDFGAARYSLGNVSHSLDVILKHGFAPREQYKRRGRQGPYTDVYSTGATLYYAITGVRPDDAIERTEEDELPFPTSLGVRISEKQEEVLMKAMAVDQQDRYQTMAEFCNALTSADIKPEKKAKPIPEKQQVPEKEQPAPKPMLPKWLVPVGAAAVLAIGVLIGTGVRSGKEPESAALAAPVQTEAAVGQSEESMPVVSIALPEPTEAVDNRPVYTMAANTSRTSDYGENQTFWGQKKYVRNEVTAIRFQDSLSNMPADAWDVSEAGDGTVMAWMTNGVLTVGADGVIEPYKFAWYLFTNFVNLKQIDFGGCFDTSNVKYMNGLFKGCSSLETLDLSGFDTSNVTDMYSMFEDCKMLTKLDLSGFDTSNVENLKSMFDSCTALTDLNISSFDTSKVTSMNYMFRNCTSLRSLDVSGFDTSKVYGMFHMFFHCETLTELDLSGFDTSNVTDMYGMFDGCKNLVHLDLSGFNSSKVSDAKMSCFFKDCYKLTDLKCSDSRILEACG